MHSGWRYDSDPEKRPTMHATHLHGPAIIIRFPTPRRRLNTLGYFAAIATMVILPLVVVTAFLVRYAHAERLHGTLLFLEGAFVLFAFAFVVLCVWDWLAIRRSRPLDGARRT